MNSKKEHDILIIGAGIGGLVCANLLSDHGFKVLIVEKHSRPGGYCVSFKRKGFVFDAAAHIIGSLGGKRNLIGRVIDNWNLDITFLPIDPLAVLKFPEEDFTIPVSVDTLINDLADRYHIKKEIIGSFFREIRKITRHYFRDNPADPLLAAYRDLSFQGLLDRYEGLENAQAVLSGLYCYVGLPPSDSSVFAMCTMLMSYLVDGTYYVKGGLQQLSNQLASRHLAQGGSIDFSTEVSKILIENDSVKGITTRKGDTVHCNTIVSNGNVLNMLPASISSSSVYRTIFNEDLQRTPATSLNAFTLYIGVKLDCESAKRLRGLHFKNKNMNSQDNMTMHVAVPSLHDATLAPAGHHVVIAMRPFSDGNRHENDIKEIAARHKETILGELESICPGFRERIVILESASPATFERYTLNTNGACYGWEKRPENMFIDVKTRINGLYQTGHWAYPNCGIAGAAYAGLTTAKKIVGEEFSI